MIGILLVLLGFNTAAMLILPALAGVFADNPALHTAFSTVAIISILIEFVLPFLLIGAWFTRRSAPAAPRYRPEPVGDYAGLNEAMTRRILDSLEARFEALSYQNASMWDDMARSRRVLDTYEREMIQHNLWSYKHPPASDAAALASDWQVVGNDMRLAAARFETEINGELVESRGDGTWYIPGRKLHVEADGTTWKEV